MKAKMTNKNFANMEQLDRIEYTLEKEKISKNMGHSYTLGFLWALVVMSWAVSVLAILMYLTFESITLLPLVEIFQYIWKPLLLMGVGMDCYNLYIYFTRKRELDKHFLTKQGAFI